jgi:hypothetical protein
MSQYEHRHTDTCGVRVAACASCDADPAWLTPSARSLSASFVTQSPPLELTLVEQYSQQQQKLRILAVEVRQHRSAPASVRVCRSLAHDRIFVRSRDLLACASLSIDSYAPVSQKPSSSSSDLTLSLSDAEIIEHESLQSNAAAPMLSPVSEEPTTIAGSPVENSKATMNANAGVVGTISRSHLTSSDSHMAEDSHLDSCSFVVLDAASITEAGSQAVKPSTSDKDHAKDGEEQRDVAENKSGDASSKDDSDASSAQKKRRLRRRRSSTFSRTISTLLRHPVLPSAVVVASWLVGILCVTAVLIHLASSSSTHEIQPVAKETAMVPLSQQPAPSPMDHLIDVLHSQKHTLQSLQGEVSSLRRALSEKEEEERTRRERTWTQKAKEIGEEIKEDASILGDWIVSASDAVDTHFNDQVLLMRSAVTEGVVSTLQTAEKAVERLSEVTAHVAVPTVSLGSAEVWERTARTVEQSFHDATEFIPAFAVSRVVKPVAQAVADGWQWISAMWNHEVIHRSANSSRRYDDHLAHHRRDSYRAVPRSSDYHY